MLSGIFKPYMLSDVMLSVVMQSVVIMSVVMLSVVIMSVEAPPKDVAENVEMDLREKEQEH